MKATGIVRRIDDLGRVVVPKEIRRTLRIREGDPLEIFTGKDGEVIFKKYSPVSELSAFSAEYAAALGAVTGFACVITDRDNVIAFAGTGRREALDKPLSPRCEEIISRIDTQLKLYDFRLTGEKDAPQFHFHLLVPRTYCMSHEQLTELIRRHLTEFTAAPQLHIEFINTYV